MSLLSDLESAGQKVETFLGNILTGEKKVVAALASVSAPTKALVLSLFNDAVKTVSSGEAAAAAAATGNIPSAITLSEATIAGFNQLITDAKAGEPVAVADLAAFGIKV